MIYDNAASFEERQSQSVHGNITENMGTTEISPTRYVEYHITNGECPLSSGVTDYGVLLVLHSSTGIEYARIDNITACKETARQLCTLLRENGVTPVALREVVEDFLA